jgi:hypothetical protein
MKNSITNSTSFLLIGQPHSENFKRLKRKINKQKVSQLFKTQTLKNTTILECIKQNLIEIKQNKSNENICILSDQNIIVHNIQNLPEPPNDWDILTLQYDVKKYLFNNEDVHWSKLEILNSNHFIINNKIIGNILEKLKTCKSFSEFIPILNTFNLYGITQSFFSEKIDHFIHFPYDKYNCKKTLQTEKNDILINYSQTAFNKLKLLDINSLDWNKTINHFDSKLLNKSPSEKYIILPSISIICIISDAPKFIHLLHTFLKLDYPMDKLELIVIDHLNIEKKLKGVIPNDKRIKIVNIQNKNTITDSKILPLGYLLNLGVKYATNNLIFNFFDTSIYFPDTFRNIVKCYLLSGKDLLIGDHTLQFNKQTNKSFKNNTYNISNMLYSKKYWLTNMFQEINDPNVILYKFISFRTNTISKIPSVFWSFQLHINQITIWNELTQIDLNLETLITNQTVKESYNLIWENF